MDHEDDFGTDRGTSLSNRDARRNDPAPDVWMPERVELLPLDEIKLPNRALRRHKKKQIKKLTEAIEKSGFLIPLVIDVNNRIVAGVARFEAARILGLPHVPCIRVTHLSEEQLRVFRIFDNRIAEDAEWDEFELSRELIELSELDIDLGMTGFEIAETDLLIETHLAKPHETACDELPPLTKTPVSQPGDIWQLGDHRIGCGDARDKSLIARLMGGAAAVTGFTDPPYNVPIDGHVSGLGEVSHREFAMAAGEMSRDEFLLFLRLALAALAEALADGSLLYTCMDWRHVDVLIAAARSLGLRLFNLCVWTKTNAGMGSFYRSQHELIAVFKKGDAPHRNNIELGRHGRNRTNVWAYAGMNSFSAERNEALKWHPTVKPVRLVADAILDCTARGDIVLDTFLGSGSTLIAAEDVGRVCYGVEIDPLYVDLVIRRWEAFTGAEAVHTATGRTFRETERGGTQLLLPPPAPGTHSDDGRAS